MSASVALEVPTAQGVTYRGAVYLSSHAATIGVIDTDGVIIAQRFHSTTCIPADDLRSIIRSLGQLAENYDLDGIGLAIGAQVSPDGRSVVQAGRMKRWIGTEIVESFNKAFPGVPVILHNDAVARALCEWQMLGHNGDMLSISIGEGLGAAWIIDDESGQPWMQPYELAHTDAPSSTGNRRLCKCGERGHLEAYTAADRIIDVSHEAGSFIAMKPTHWAKIVEPLAEALARETAEHPVDLIVVGGERVDSHPQLFQAFVEAMRRHGSQTDIVRSPLLSSKGVPPVRAASAVLDYLAVAVA